MIDFSKLDDNEMKHLVQRYFEELAKNSILPFYQPPKIIRTGAGSDDGVDLLVEFYISDGITEIITRKYVVQIKKYLSRNVAPSDLVDDNLPTLVHANQAHGYLLICADGISEKLRKLFEKLNKTPCPSFTYMIWDGPEFKRRLNLYQQLITEIFTKSNEQP